MKKVPGVEMGEVNRKESILIAAEELFARKGFEGASIREIARKAKINTALIYYYFGDKENLFRATLERTLIEIPRILEDAISTTISAEEGLDRILRMITGMVSQRSRFFQILHRELAIESPRVSFLADKYFLRNYQLVKSFMEKATSSGQFRKLDLELAPITFMAMILFFFYNRFLVRRVLRLDPFEEKFIQRLSIHTLDLFLHGASADRPSANPKRRLSPQSACRRTSQE
jgi:AcrR family transcriptional regulator